VVITKIRNELGIRYWELGVGNWVLSVEEKGVGSRQWAVGKGLG